MGSVSRNHRNLPGLRNPFEHKRLLFSQEFFSVSLIPHKHYLALLEEFGETEIFLNTFLEQFSHSFGAIQGSIQIDTSSHSILVSKATLIMSFADPSLIGGQMILLNFTVGIYKASQVTSRQKYGKPSLFV